MKTLAVLLVALMLGAVGAPSWAKDKTHEDKNHENQIPIH